MNAPRRTDRLRPKIGVYGWGVVAPGARNADRLAVLLESSVSALALDRRPELGAGLFAVGDPQFDFADYEAWIGERRGDAYAARLRAKTGDNVQFVVGATIQALVGAPGLEPLLRELDERCHVYVGSGVGELSETLRAGENHERAMRAWNRYWADPARCAPRRRYEGDGAAPSDSPPPCDPRTLPVDSEARVDALHAWHAYWAPRSEALAVFLERFAAIEQLDDDPTRPDAHVGVIRKRVRAHRALVEATGCPTPPWDAVSPNLVWNIQNGPAAQLTMLLDIHGPSWAPVGACATFGVALKCGADAIERGEATAAIIGTADPRPIPELVAAFHQARVTPATGDVNAPLTTLRGTHVSGGACVWVVGDAAWFESRGLRPLAYVEAVALSSDAEHIITPSKDGPKRAIRHAYERARIRPEDVAIVDLHATGTPGDLTELSLVSEFIGDHTRVTARKGQLGHGMSNSGGWELTAMAMSLARRRALPTGIDCARLHPRVLRPDAIVGPDEAPLDGDIGVKLMLGIGGITACVVIRAAVTQ
ncbi:MAG: beta-ketoacyl synthase N-terminal-like domain-containing protein [Polyangiaceae bacterium]|jgi:3-oxoacyl-(acyl-carrier-protein) synthase